MNRRTFLKSALAAGGLPGWRGFAAPSDRRWILSAPVTHSDWMLKDGVAWGVEGVRQMLDKCKECGWSRIYWRVIDGGRALYKSNLLQPMGGLGCG